jgi:hypothetical protein
MPLLVLPLNEYAGAAAEPIGLARSGKLVEPPPKAAQALFAKPSKALVFVL